MLPVAQKYGVIQGPAQAVHRPLTLGCMAAARRAGRTKVRIDTADIA